MSELEREDEAIEQPPTKQELIAAMEVAESAAIFVREFVKTGAVDAVRLEELCAKLHKLRWILDPIPGDVESTDYFFDRIQAIHRYTGGRLRDKDVG